MSISLVVGDTGVFTEADKATTNTDRAGAKEALDRAIMGLQGKFTDVWNDDTNETFYNYIIAEISKEGAQKDKILVENGYTIKIEKVQDSNLKDVIVGTIQKGDSDNDVNTKYVFELKQRGEGADADFLGIDVVKLEVADLDAITSGSGAGQWSEKDKVYNGTASDRLVEGVEELIP